MSLRLSRQEFRAWSAAQPNGRFERSGGEVVAMAPERWAHARLKARIWRALDREITSRALPCQAAPDGLTVEINDDTDHEPDALVNCGPALADDSMVAPNPVVIVEVPSPGTAGVDTGEKLADYFRVSSVRHYLIVRPTRREIIHHARMDDRIDTRIVRDGAIRLDPPGISLAVDEVYGARPPWPFPPFGTGANLRPTGRRGNEACAR